MEFLPAGTGEVSRFVFAGRFGSGKTEIAINFALLLACRSIKSADRQVTLIDLDVVTSYFRSRERAEELRAHGVEVIAPATVAGHLDTPGITREILGELEREDRLVVIDVGGDPQGARALGQFQAVLRQRRYQMFFVVNPYRPFTEDTEGIKKSIVEIEETARLWVTGLVSNPHLMDETTLSTFIKGHRIVERASRQLALPIVFTVLDERLAAEASSVLPAEMPMMILRRFFLLPWDVNLEAQDRAVGVSGRWLYRRLGN